MRLARPVRFGVSAYAFALALPLVSCRDDAAPGSMAEPMKPQPSHPSPQAGAPPAPPVRMPGPKAVPSAQDATSRGPVPSAIPAYPPGDSVPSSSMPAKDDMLEIIRRRASQEKPKMKLTADEALRAERYLRNLQSMPQCGLLSRKMPKTAVELLRAVHERGVPRREAEAISMYLIRLHESMKMRNPGPFDENTSHVIGREWHEIDYSGEGMSWQSQKRFYSRHGIVDLRTEENVRKMFALESTFPYFRRIYKPEGKLPDF